MKVTVHCTNCGAEIERLPSEIKKSKGDFFCNRECKMLWHQRVVNCTNCGAEIKRYSGDVKNNKGNFFCNRECKKQWHQAIVNCASCGAQLERTLGVTKNNTSGNFFCNQECRRQWLLKNWQGENSPAYKGKPPQELTCSQCGQKFLKRPSQLGNNKNIFCSKKCQYDWQREHKINQHLKKRIMVKCDQCGTEFERIQSQLQRASDNIFCSKSCFYQWRSVHVRGEQIYNWKGPVEVPCATCGKILSRPQAQVRSSEHQFCDHQCYAVWLSETQKGENSHRWRGGKITVNCATCGKPVERIRSEVESRSERFFCSLECSGKWRSLNVVGENHPNWKGGWLPYYGPNWHIQRDATRKRDSYRCQHCGISEKKYGQKLDVHHIRSFREFGYIPGKNENYKQANELKNLITLCRYCHLKAEHGHIAIQPALL